MPESAELGDEKRLGGPVLWYLHLKPTTTLDRPSPSMINASRGAKDDRMDVNRYGPDNLGAERHYCIGAGGAVLASSSGVLNRTIASGLEGQFWLRPAGVTAVFWKKKSAGLYRTRR